MRRVESADGGRGREVLAGLDFQFDCDDSRTFRVHFLTAAVSSSTVSLMQMETPARHFLASAAEQFPEGKILELIRSPRRGFERRLWPGLCAADVFRGGGKIAAAADLGCLPFAWARDRW